MKNAAGELFKCHFPYQLHVNKPWLFTVNTGLGRSCSAQSIKNCLKTRSSPNATGGEWRDRWRNHNKEKIVKNKQKKV